MRILIILLTFCAYAHAGPVTIYGIPTGATPTTQPNPVNVNSSGQITTTLMAGEDETNDVIRVEGQFEYCAGIVADGQCGSPATFLHSVTCAGDDAAATAGSLAIRDSTSAGAGTIIQNVNFAAAYFPPVTMIFDVNLTNGLYLDFTTTADVECSASYR